MGEYWCECRCDKNSHACWMGYNTEIQFQDGSWCSAVSVVIVLWSERFGKRRSMFERKERRFRRIETVTVSFVVFVSPSVHMGQFGSYWMDVHEILYFNIFRKYFENIQISLKYNKNNVYFAWRPIYIYYTISFNSSFSKKCFTQGCRPDKIINFIFSKILRKSCHLWDNVKMYGGARVASDEQYNAAHAPWMPDNQGYRHTLRIYKTYYFFTAVMVTRTRLNVIFIVHVLSFFMSPHQGWLSGPPIPQPYAFPCSSAVHVIYRYLRTAGSLPWSQEPVLSHINSLNTR